MTHLVLTGKCSEEKHSLIIHNYPCPSPKKGAIHEIEILTGIHQNAYYIGNYGQCSELARDFERELNNFLNHDD